MLVSLGSSFPVLGVAGNRVIEFGEGGGGRAEIDGIGRVRIEVHGDRAGKEERRREEKVNRKQEGDIRKISSPHLVDSQLVALEQEADIGIRAQCWGIGRALSAAFEKTDGGHEARVVIVGEGDLWGRCCHALANLSVLCERGETIRGGKEGR